MNRLRTAALVQFRRMTGLLVVLILVQGVGNGLAGAKQANGSEQAVARMLIASDGLSAQTNLAAKAMATRFKAIVTSHFALGTMARDALGYDRFNQLGTKRQRQYTEAFKEHLAQGFVLGVRRLGSAVSTVLGSRTAPGGAVIVVSRSRVAGREKDTFWHMCREHPALVCDIEVDGIRASARQRAAFSRVLEEHGFERLLTDLRSGELAGRIS
ncbi:ABC transporter substrate-binding protein [Roseibium aggregatum]|uniref:ABC transporter substrate-binding protein n=1 Tax=Roseibium aggregatum TaxID=187304 RepID=A0A939EJM7_9HYPH|nr:ABC transporter substrate-binding protein [Roseibium aggregatum]MBN9673627.1 ABC transporter substrate-binding protein [Roseibium aggregatum]